MDEVERLLQLLQLGDARERKRAADALGARGDVRAVEGLCLALNDEEFSVRKHAAQALVRIGAPAMERLCNRLSSSVYHIRWWVVEALKQIGDAQAVVEFIHRTENTQAVETLCKVIGDHNFSMDRWKFVCEVIGKLNLSHRELLPPLRAAHARIAEVYPSFAGVILAAIERIEKATEATKNLPRPANAPMPDTTTLPRPAGAPAFDVDKLPRPVD
jgi:hypothetical protein